MNYEAQANDLREALGLEYSPIAITFSDDPDTEGSVDKQVSVCKAIEKTLYDNMKAIQEVSEKIIDRLEKAKGQLIPQVADIASAMIFEALGERWPIFRINS